MGTPKRMDLVIKFRTGVETSRKLDELAASNVGGQEMFLYHPAPLTRSIVLRYLVEKAYQEMLNAEAERKLAKEAESKLKKKKGEPAETEVAPMLEDLPVEENTDASRQPDDSVAPVDAKSASANTTPRKKGRSKRRK